MEWISAQAYLLLEKLAVPLQRVMVAMGKEAICVVRSGHEIARRSGSDEGRASNATFCRNEESTTSSRKRRENVAVIETIELFADHG